MKEQSFKRVYLLIAKAIGLVAQLVRAPPCHGGGRGFEPHPGRCYHFPDDNLLETAYNYIWGLSSAGRASALQAEGHRFEPCRPHSKYNLSEKEYNGYMGEFPSGQRGQTVNLLALPSVVRIHLRPVKYLLTNET